MNNITIHINYYIHRKHACENCYFLTHDIRKLYIISYHHHLYHDIIHIHLYCTSYLWAYKQSLEVGRLIRSPQAGLSNLTDLCQGYFLVNPLILQILYFIHVFNINQCICYDFYIFIINLKDFKLTILQRATKVFQVRTW